MSQLSARQSEYISDCRFKISDLFVAGSTNSDDLKRRTKSFALMAMRLCQSLPRSQASTVITRQLLRSATSVDANYRAVCRARSTADFVSKLGIVLEEADETLFWLELLIESGAAHPDKTAPLLKEANELVSIFVAWLRTAKGLKSAI
jgi:four helix bundle protein